MTSYVLKSAPATNRLRRVRTYTVAELTAKQDDAEGVNVAIAVKVLRI